MTEKIANNELQAFVSSTLAGIAEGVAEGSKGDTEFEIESSVAFDVAVTAVKSSGGGGGLKLQVFNVEGEMRSQNETVSRISFSVRAKNANADREIQYKGGAPA